MSTTAATSTARMRPRNFIRNGLRDGNGTL
jgi:hypothetical protein